ncbi:MAG: hypothetical protein K0S14_3702, partial [Thermomicrobiales bacterium]|nr:hypothetical protein [Thermomicrobiales bacterium]
LIQSRYGLGGRGGLAGRMASAGTGGRANASADGGIVVIGKINSGGNRGNTINVGNIGGGYGECGPVYIDGGNVENSTNIDIDAGGGTAIGDASGGSGNLAAVSGGDDSGGNGGRGGLRGLIQSRYGLGGGGNGGDVASAGNGGIAGASADGGIVVINEINSGGNQGNTIEVGDICVAPVYVPPAPAKPGKPTKPGKTIKTIKAPTGRPGRGGGGGKVRVSRVPSTGVGHIPTSPASVTMIPIAVLPVRREDADGVQYEDNWIR